MNIKIYAVITLLLLVGVMCLTAKYKDAIWQERMTKLEQSITELHNNALQELLNKERESRERAAQIEVAYHDQTRTINTLASDNRRLADELGMRDPFTQCSSVNGSSGNATSNSTNSASTGRLSKETTQFLLGLAEDADRMSAYAWTCYHWVNRHKPSVIEPPPMLDKN